MLSANYDMLYSYVLNMRYKLRGHIIPEKSLAVKENLTTDFTDYAEKFNHEGAQKKSDTDEHRLARIY